MAEKVTVSLKLDCDTAIRMKTACEDMGLSMSEAFIIFAKKVARERRIPFEIIADNDSDSSNAIGALKRISTDAKRRGLSDMTLDEINEEIAVVRKERKG